jgi:uncharacterized protein
MEPSLSWPTARGSRSSIALSALGVWLDRGELDKLIERSVPAAAPPPPPQGSAPRGYDDHSQHHRGNPKKKRGGFLEELFDF